VASFLNYNEMKKILLSVIFVLVMSVIAFAQKDYQDVVYLKNGSIIRGVIIEQIPNVSIKIETVGENVFFYKIDEIEKLTKEPEIFVCLKKGYQFILEGGIAFCSGSNYRNYNYFNFNIINGYRFNPYFSVGLGIGSHFYSAANQLIVPLYLDVRTNLTKSRVTPYLAFGIGYSLSASNDFKKYGFIMSPEFGISIRSENKYAINIGLGFELQNATMPQGWYEPFYYIDDYYNRPPKTETMVGASFKIGILF
jgi:hypothetical protein